MATREQIYQAILNADKAGDGESVRSLGAYLKTMPADTSANPVGQIPVDASKEFPAPAPVADKTTGQKVADFIRPTVEGVATVGGGMIGAPLGPLGAVGGAGLGYGFGAGAMRLVDNALAPTPEPPKSLGENLLQGAKDVATGSTMEAGGRVIVPMLAKGAGWVGNKISNAIDLIRPSGAENILNRYTVQAVGEQNLPAVVNAAKNVKEIIPGGKPTLGQAVSGMPEGSPLQAMEAVTAKTSGGPSTQFGQRIAEQSAAEKSAIEARTAASKINYGKAFDPVLHKLKPDAELAAIAQNPYFQSAVPTAEKVAAAKGLNINDNLTEILHNVKMGLDKKLNPGFGEIGIDNAEKGAVLDLKNRLTNWLVKNNSDYAVGRAEHALASKDIKSFTDRIELANNPLQPTALRGGINIADETRIHMPNMLSRPMMIANAVTRALGNNVEGKIDAISTLRHLEPAEFAKAMERLSASQKTQLMTILKDPSLWPAGSSAAAVNALAQ